MPSRGSVSRFIADLKLGDEAACRELFERYFARLVQLARKKRRGASGRVADEEDVAVSVFATLFSGARRDRFPLLSNRNDLWGLLIVLTARKAANQIAYLNRLKHGGGKVRGESAFEVIGSEPGKGGIDRVLDNAPGPETGKIMEEAHRELLGSLGDDKLRQIATWSMEGYTNQEIANMLGCSLRTVARKLALIRTIWSARRPK